MFACLCRGTRVLETRTGDLLPACWHSRRLFVVRYRSAVHLNKGISPHESKWIPTQFPSRNGGEKQNWKMRRGHVVAGAAMNSEQRDERDGDRPEGINSSPYWARSSSLARALTLRYLVIIRGKVRAQSEQLKEKVLNCPPSATLSPRSDWRGERRIKEEECSLPLC